MVCEGKKAGGHGVRSPAFTQAALAIGKLSNRSHYREDSRKRFSVPYVRYSFLVYFRLHTVPASSGPLQLVTRDPDDTVFDATGLRENPSVYAWTFTTSLDTRIL